MTQANVFLAPLERHHALQMDRGKDEMVDQAVAAIEHWLDRFDVVVVGPGLGRDELVHQTVIEVLSLL